MWSCDKNLILYPITLCCNYMAPLIMIWFDLLLSHVLVDSEKYCFLCAIQTKHTIHREGKESAECSVTVIARVQRKVNLMWGRSIQKLMAARKKLFLSRLVRDLRLLYLYPNGRRWKRECLGCVGSLIVLAAFPRQQEVYSKKSYNTRLKSNRFIW